MEQPSPGPRHKPAAQEEHKISLRCTLPKSGQDTSESLLTSSTSKASVDFGAASVESWETSSTGSLQSSNSSDWMTAETSRRASYPTWCCREAMQLSLERRRADTTNLRESLHAETLRLELLEDTLRRANDAARQLQVSVARADDEVKCAEGLATDADKYVHSLHQRLGAKDLEIGRLRQQVQRERKQWLYERDCVIHTIGVRGLLEALAMRAREPTSGRSADGGGANGTWRSWLARKMRVLTLAFAIRMVW